MKKRFQDLIERNRWMKGIPNSLTLCNSLCGFASIIVVMEALKVKVPCFTCCDYFFCLGAFLILFAMVFDALDGFAARLLNAGSMHGLQMDSLADMTTFGVAPAVLVAVMANILIPNMTRNQFVVICILCAVYLGCAALRLATYNVHAILEKKSSEKFSGLPSPGAAAAICTLVIFCAKAHEILPSSDIICYLPFYAALLGLLMVSNIPYTHFAKWIISCKRNRRRMIFLILLFVAWAVSGFAMKWKFGNYNWYAFPTLVVNVYVIWGPIAYLAVKLGIIHAQEGLSEK